jgi:predicted RNase H-like HicB family nuclease
MSPDNRILAEELANRPYSIEIRRDETTNGEPVYLARVLELEGCLAQGETEELAEQDLNAAKIDFIESLLNDGLPVPQPAPFTVSTQSSPGITITVTRSVLLNHSKKHNTEIHSTILIAS